MPAAPAFLTGFFDSFRSFMINTFVISVITYFFNELQALGAEVLSWILTQVGDFIDVDPIQVIYSGFSGYIISILRIDDCLTVYLGALAARFIMGFIPFL